MMGKWNCTQITVEPHIDLVEQLWIEACQYANQELEVRCSVANPQSIEEVNAIYADIMAELTADFKRQVDEFKMTNTKSEDNDIIAMARKLTPSRIAEKLCSVQPMEPHLFSDVYQAFRERDLQLRNRESQNDSPYKE